mmetsp:Transcript_27356/g.46541  ORF Transcript_27356/g.46541 Transcript_27356/m.46541 type:complete len:104 (-) Transcript_27356:512-823(-)
MSISVLQILIGTENSPEEVPLLLYFKIEQASFVSPEKYNNPHCYQRGEYSSTEAGTAAHSLHGLLLLNEGAHNLPVTAACPIGIIDRILLLPLLSWKPFRHPG